MSAPKRRRRPPPAAAAAPVRALNVVQLFGEEHPPIVQRRIRGRYPKGVVPIRAVPRLRVGVRVQFYGSLKSPADNGATGVITKYEDGAAGYRCLVKFDRAIVCNDGALDREVWCRKKNLRRLWDWRQVEEIRRMKALIRIDTLAQFANGGTP